MLDLRIINGHLTTAEEVCPRDIGIYDGKIAVVATPGTLPEVSCRIKMGETSDVMAVVQTSSGVFSASRVVKVTIGGCGG